MSNYRKGRSYEYRIKKKLEKEGWMCLRTAGSHGLFDLIAIWNKWPTQPDHPAHRWIKLIQCKSGKSKLRMVKDVLKTDIKRWEGLYAVSVEVI